MLQPVPCKHFNSYFFLFSSSLNAASELPRLENGFYQFLYVTRESEICGASMPFQINNTISKELDDDIVADCSEDDFLVVRSNIAEKNRRLQALLDEMTEKCLSHESAMKAVQLQLKVVTEEKIKLDHSLKQACAEKLNLINESQRIAEEKDIVCSEKEVNMYNFFCVNEVRGLPRGNIESVFGHFIKLNIKKTDSSQNST